MPDYKVMNGKRLVAQFSNRKKAEAFIKSRDERVVVSYNTTGSDLAEDGAPS